MKPSWERALELSLRPSQHYSLSPEKRQLLFWCAAAAPENPLFVEIGVCHGGTAMMLAYVAKCLGGRYVGIDTGTPVDDADYRVPFPFTGKIHKLTVKLGPEELTPAEREMIYGTYRDRQ